MSEDDKAFHDDLNVAPLSDAGRNGYLVRPEEWVLVTGANGYVGSRVVRTLLSYGFKHIRCFTRPTSKSRNLEVIAEEFGGASLDIVTGNLLTPGDCRRTTERVSIVYHLPAGVEKSYPGCFLNSVVATRNLLEALIKERVIKRFVNVSSIAVYTNEKIPRASGAKSFL